MSVKGQAGHDAVTTKRAYWGQRITEWEHSGQSQKVFCAEHGLVLSTFQWWCAKR